VDGQNRAYTYSHRSQMTGLTDTNAVASAYGFDADQNRVTENAVRYVYDGPNVVLEIESSLPKAAYVHGRGIDQPIERIQFIAGVADGRHVYHTDALGSVWAMTDNLEVVAKAYTYEAFGKIRSETGAGLLFTNRYTYTDRESIGDSLGFYYYRGRVMDPNVGRFTSADPLGFVDGPNVFIYVTNKPLIYADPTGKLITGVGVSGFIGWWIAGSGSAFYCQDNCSPQNSGFVVCIGGGIGAGASVGVGVVIGSGCLTDGWTGQLTAQAAAGPGGACGSVSGTDGSGGASIGPGAGLTVTFEGCYKF
jgi:RHS repeat-associated protein